jgi:DNA-binding response OmpR family regulator
VRLLVVEDYPPLRVSLVRGLVDEGYAVDAAPDARTATWHLDGGSYDAVVLDRMLPDGDGTDVLRRLRARGDRTPVLLLTALDAVDDRVAGLDAGADDYLVKPFAVPELLAWLRRLVRRAHGDADPLLRCGALVVDPAARTVRCGAAPVELSPREFRLLEYLLRRRGAVVPRSELWDHLYDFASDTSSNVLDVLVARLRRKLAAAGADDLIRTRRGEGYAIGPSP